MPRQCRQSSHGRDKPPELRTRAAAGHCLDRKKTTRPDANRIWTGQAFLRGGAVGRRSIRSGRRKGAVLVRNRRKWPLGSRAAVRWGAAAVVAPFPSVEARTVGRMDHGAPRFPLICKILLQNRRFDDGPGPRNAWKGVVPHIAMPLATQSATGWLSGPQATPFARPAGPRRNTCPLELHASRGYLRFGEARARQHAPRCGTGLTCGLATRSSRTDGRSFRRGAARAARSPRERPAASPSTTRR